MKRLGLVTLTLALVVIGATTALAQDLSGHVDLVNAKGRSSGCHLKLVSLTRVDRQLIKMRVVRASGLLMCDRTWNDGNLIFRVVKSGGSPGSAFAEKHFFLDDLSAGRTRFHATLECNWKQKGQWQHPPNTEVGLFAWGQVRGNKQKPGFKGYVRDDQPGVTC